MRASRLLRSGGRKYNSRLVDAIRPLSDEQLKLRAAPVTMADLGARRPYRRHAGLLALRRVQGEWRGDTPFTDASGYGWEDDREHAASARTSSSLALESSWRIVERCLGSLDDIDAERRVQARDRRKDADGTAGSRSSCGCSRMTPSTRARSRRSSGANGLPEIDLWRSRPSSGSERIVLELRAPAHPARRTSPRLDSRRDAPLPPSMLSRRCAVAASRRAVSAVSRIKLGY